MRSKKHHIDIDGIPIEVTRKRVKHLRIVVYRSSGFVRISSPKRVSDREIYRFAESKIDWVKKHLQKKSSSDSLPAPKFTDGEMHYLWGEPYRLRVKEENAAPQVCLNGSGEINMFIRPKTAVEKREKVMREWYRAKMKQEIPPLIEKWEPVMGVTVADWGVKKMKTRWGTCNVRDRKIWLSLHLAKRDPEFLEYIVVHEMTHLLERLHSRRFYGLMDQFLPGWRETDKKLGGKHWKK